MTQIKMTLNPTQTMLAPLAAAFSFAMTASAHFKAYGTKKEDLAAVSVANYNYASDNPKAQMQRKLTIGRILFLFIRALISV